MDIIWKLYGDNMESDGTYYGDLIVKLIRRLSGNFIFHVLSIKTENNLQTNVIIKFL